MLHADDSGRKHPALQRGPNMLAGSRASNAGGRMSAMSNRKRRTFANRMSAMRNRGPGLHFHKFLEVPALRVGHQEVAEHLDTGHCLELFRIDKEGIERQRIGLAEQLHQPAVLFHQIVRQHRDA